MIDGVKITPLRQIFDERGKVMHMLRSDSEIFEKFGEIYFSCTYPGVVKAWHRHKEMTLNYAVILGEIKFVLFDDRQESKTKGKVQEIFVSPENYNLITVPPRIWNGFKGIGNQTAIVANCSNIPHDPSEIERLEASSNEVPYVWDLIHK